MRRGDQAMLLRKERDAAVHGAGVEVQEIEMLRDHARKRTLAGGGIAVNGDGDVRESHNRVVQLQY